MLDGFNFKIYTEAKGMQLENWCSTKSLNQQRKLVYQPKKKKL